MKLDTACYKSKQTAWTLLYSNAYPLISDQVHRLFQSKQEPYKALGGYTLKLTLRSQLRPMVSGILSIQRMSS